MIFKSVCLILTIVGLSLSGDIPTDFNSLKSTETCDVSYCQFMTSSVLTTATSYFADNPRGQEDALSSKDWQVNTPEELYKSYYGPSASVVNFKQVAYMLSF